MNFSLIPKQPNRHLVMSDLEQTPLLISNKNELIFYSDKNKPCRTIAHLQSNRATNITFCMLDEFEVDYLNQLGATPIKLNVHNVCVNTNDLIKNNKTLKKNRIKGTYSLVHETLTSDTFTHNANEICIYMSSDLNQLLWVIPFDQVATQNDLDENMPICPPNAVICHMTYIRPPRQSTLIQNTPFSGIQSLDDVRTWIKNEQAVLCTPEFTYEKINLTK